MRRRFREGLTISAAAATITLRRVPTRARGHLVAPAVLAGIVTAARLSLYMPLFRGFTFLQLLPSYGPYAALAFLVLRREIGTRAAVA